MTGNLVLSVHLHDRFHGMAFGAPEWPPSPGRVFQALVAGVARGQEIPEPVAEALAWLETLPPPRVAVPPARLGADTTFFVPNNDLDAKGGDPARVGELRVPKRSLPRIVAGDVPLLYVWSWTEGADYAQLVATAAEELYQLGRGIDLAWAHGDVLDDVATERLLAKYPGVVHEPAGPGDRTGSLCPVPGSLASLRRRFAAARLREVVEGKKRTELFENAPKPVFRPFRYGRRFELVSYELVHDADVSQTFPVRLDRAAALVTAVRDAVAARLRVAFPEAASEVERVVIGRKADGRDGGPREDRLRIIPLPSIGHPDADMAVRRLAVSIPGGSTIAVEDLAWAFDGLTVQALAVSQHAFVLARNAGDNMLDRYARSAREFRSVTPVVLPRDAARRRIEPARRREEAKGGSERAGEEQRAQAAVRMAVRHAGIAAHVQRIAVQREPFDRRGGRAEPFAEDTRFAKERLWHVQVTLDRAVEGPVAIGDGRFLGLGVLAPAEESVGVLAFAIESGLAADAHPMNVTAALRRAVMARVQEAIGPRAALATFFSGHEAQTGGPAGDAEDPHLFYAFDPEARRLLVIAPHAIARDEPHGRERYQLDLLERALKGFLELRAGRAGLLSLQRVPFDGAADPLTRSARAWRSVTPYQVNRHARNTSPQDAVAQDVRAECRRRGLPQPEVTVGATRGIAGVGLQAEVELRFSHAVSGPLLLGRTRHTGGGLFAIAPSDGSEDRR